MSDALFVTVTLTRPDDPQMDDRRWRREAVDALARIENAADIVNRRTMVEASVDHEWGDDR